MKVLFAAYRDWAIKIKPAIERHPNVEQLFHVTNLDDLEKEARTRAYDVVLLCGWSWQVSKELLSLVPVVSEHPCFKDEYSLGTPLQAQILDGIEYTKHRIVKVGYPELIDRQYAHEVDMNLSGNMDQILEEMTSTARTIYMRFLNDWPNIEWKTWDKATRMLTPRRPSDSQLSREELLASSTKQLYDRIRCLEAPYPNAFIEDEHGTLYFERVKFKAKK